MEAAPNHYEDNGYAGNNHMGNRRPMTGNVPFSKMVFDGKRMRKAIQRRTVDYNHSVARWMQVRKTTNFAISVLNKETFVNIPLFSAILLLGASMDSRSKRHASFKTRSQLYRQCKLIELLKATKTKCLTSIDVTTSRLSR